MDMTAEEQKLHAASSPPLPSFLHLHTRPKQIHFQHLREGETRYLSPSLPQSHRVKSRASKTVWKLGTQICTDREGRRE